MKVGFYLSEKRNAEAYVLADAMVRSVRNAMPGVQVHQFTDERSGILWGVDSYSRKDGKIIQRLRLEHYAAEGEWLFIDTDCIMQRALEIVPHGDIAIADRNGSLLPAEVGSDFMLRMPYNLGVVYSRCPEFWKAALEKWDSYDTPTKEAIWSDQLAVCATIKAGSFLAYVLPGATTNLAPMTEDQDVSGAAVVHYKGKRKAWMLKRIMAEL